MNGHLTRPDRRPPKAVGKGRPPRPAFRRTALRCAGAYRRTPAVCAARRRPAGWSDESSSTPRVPQLG
eukprot:9167106-Alexandrium_andersonii.AAC.1